MCQFSVVIPTFNRARLLRRAVESVLGQTVRANQVIVVDDGSTDDTAEVCRKYADSIEYVRQPNAGVAAARNHGMNLSRHPWIAFLDSDDHWTPTHLEKMAAAIKGTSGQANFYFADISDLGGADGRTLWSRIGFKFAEPFLLTPDGTSWMLSCRQPSSIQCSVFSAAALKASGGFDRRFRVSEDTELFCRLGIGSGICAVNNLGCVRTSDDNPDNRLTGVVHNRTISHRKHTCMLWSSLLSRFPDLNPSYRRVIRHNLADGYWRLARICWKSGQVPNSIIALLRLATTEPSFLIWLLRNRKSTGWGENVEPRCVAVASPAVRDTSTRAVEMAIEKST